MGDIWAQAIRNLPPNSIQPPAGPDPVRPPHDGPGPGSDDGDDGGDSNASANGGPDPSIPAPDFGPPAVRQTTQDQVNQAANDAFDAEVTTCNGGPVWHETSKIANGIGTYGPGQFLQNWQSANKVADGLHSDASWVHLADMDGDGKADYLVVDVHTGALTCWLNHLPAPWAPAGADGGIIADGAGPGNAIFFADMNGDGKADYLVVDDNSGAVTVFWNGGADPGAQHGWRFDPGGVIATGVPHANLKTIRFADINGDGRADYIIVGQGGSAAVWINTGSPGGTDVKFLAQGGIASGASDNIDNVVFADVNGDGMPPLLSSSHISSWLTLTIGRADYLIWDQDGGLSGFMNTRTQSYGVPYFTAQQNDPKGIAQGIGQPPGAIRLADLDGDGKVDYCFIDPADGAIWLWWNRGGAEDAAPSDGLRFADINGDGLDDYVWLDPISGAPLVYMNGKPTQQDPLGWAWIPVNGGNNPIASGSAPAGQVQFGDIDGDGLADYLVTDPKTGALSVWLNGNAKAGAIDGWQWNPVGQIASGLGPGANKNVRFADIDGMTPLPP